MCTYIVVWKKSAYRFHCTRRRLGLCVPLGRLVSLSHGYPDPRLGELL